MSASAVPTPEECHLLTPAQEAVIALMSAGSTIAAAAESAGVHRNTVLNWRRHSAHFRLALWRAEEEKALFWRDKAEELASSAIEALRGILADPSAAASVRLKAVLYILGQVTAPPEVTAEVEVAAKVVITAESEAARNQEKTVHNSAQSRPAEAPACTHPAPKIGRNDYCPCGSGKKYKRCCIDKAIPHTGSIINSRAELAALAAMTL